jgi:hypothetical protein
MCVTDFSFQKHNSVPSRKEKGRRKFNPSSTFKIISFILCVQTLIVFGMAFQGRLGSATVLVGALSNLTNQERQLNNLKPLKINPLLSKAAQLKAEDMAKNSYFSHTSPEGKTPWYWLDVAGYKYDYAGENLAINFNETKDVVDAWMNSPAHRDNIIKSLYTEVGSGVATGTYEGKTATFIVQDYADPRSSMVNDYSRELSSEEKIPQGVGGNILGASIDMVSSSSDSQSFISKKIIYILFSVLLILILITIFFKTLLAFFIKHPGILNFLLIIIVLILGASILVGYFGNKNGLLTSSFSFSIDHTQDGVVSNQ